MTNINSEMVMILVSIIALFLTVLAGFGGMVTFLWNQFGKVHQTLSEIKLEYVQKQECADKRSNCVCTARMTEMNKKFDDLHEEFEKLKDERRRKL